MDLDRDLFFEKFGELTTLYSEIKRIIIIAENLNDRQAVNLTSINELRNSFDHLMRIIEYPDKLESEFSEAREHLYRAGFDTLELLAINQGEKISNLVENYSADILSLVFPKYYIEIHPKLIEIKADLADARSHKRLNPETGTKSFEHYKTSVLSLINLEKQTAMAIPAIEAEVRRRVAQAEKESQEKEIAKQEEIDREARAKSGDRVFDIKKSIAIGVFIAIVSALLGAYAKSFFENKNPVPTDSPATKPDSSLIKPK